MNIAADAKTILCFGDSNTFGQRPDDHTQRWPASKRWTGVLQELLGEAYYVVEEGLSSRTTDLDYANNQKPGRNGRPYFLPCLLSHRPLDCIVIMLGTNDMKVEFNRSVEEIVTAIAGYIDEIEAVTADNTKQLKIILMTPPHIDASQPLFTRDYGEVIFDQSSVEKSHAIAPVLATLAKQRGCEFFDVSEVATPGIDGIHLDESSHKRVGEALTQKITGIAEVI